MDPTHGWASVHPGVGVHPNACSPRAACPHLHVPIPRAAQSSSPCCCCCCCCCPSQSSQLSPSLAVPTEMPALPWLPHRHPSCKHPLQSPGPCWNWGLLHSGKVSQGQLWETAPVGVLHPWDPSTPRPGPGGAPRWVSPWMCEVWGHGPAWKAELRAGPAAGRCQCSGMGRFGAGAEGRDAESSPGPMVSDAGRHRQHWRLTSCTQSPTAFWGAAPCGSHSHSPVLAAPSLLLVADGVA